MNTNQFVRHAFVVALLCLTSTSALAHVTKGVGQVAAYTVVAGFVGAPLYAGQVEQVELTITDAAGNPVEGLAASLTLEILAPGGTTLVVPVRGVRGSPGRYVADFIPTVAGNYDVRLSGFIGEFEFDEVFSGVDMVHADPVVNDPASISVP
ncbi:MAG: hypothetical protein KF813_06420 [Trueperaceae bacterium]|nr:hypothetical protein [Trueperaceae bacterium]